MVSPPWEGRGCGGGAHTGLWVGEGEVFVVVLSGGQAVVEHAQEAVEQVALCGGVAVAVFAASAVVGEGAGRGGGHGPAQSPGAP